jgi:hypothetical protein
MCDGIRAPENGQSGPKTGQKALREGFAGTPERLATSTTVMDERSMSIFSTACYCVRADRKTNGAP